MLDAEQNDDAASECDDEHEPRRRKRKPTSIRVAALNITSFLDMSFCLLTFLILSASMATPEGVLAAKLPVDIDHGAPGAPPEKELRITIASNNVESYRIAIDGMPAATPDFKTLTAQLEQLQFSDRNPAGIYRSDNPIVIVAANDCHWQHVVNAFNAAVSARYSNVSFQSQN